MGTRHYHNPIFVCLCLLVLVWNVGCQAPPEANMEPDELPSPAYLDGQEKGDLYIQEKLEDYEVVAILYELNTTERRQFLDGFAQSIQDSGRPSEAVTYRQILQEAVTGNQFARASELGSKHALHAVNNEQIQGVIQSSLGVSRGVVLGWKSGYIKGFTAQRVAQTTAKGSVDEEIIRQLRHEAAATYFALRAAIGG